MAHGGEHLGEPRAGDRRCGARAHPRRRLMTKDGLRLTAYFGERDRVTGGLLADALMDVYERHAVSASALFRGIEGFGVGHGLQTERLLTLSEDLPMVAVAVDAEERIGALIDEVREINRRGMTTLERVQVLSR